MKASNIFLIINVLAMVIFLTGTLPFNITFPVQIGALFLQFFYARKESLEEFENEQ